MRTKAKVDAQLTVEQQIALQLLLRGKSSDDIEHFFGWQAGHVRQTAHAGLTVLGGTRPAITGQLALEDTIDDFILGRQPALEDDVRDVLVRDDVRAWCRKVLAELRTIAPPAIPLPDLRLLDAATLIEPPTPEPGAEVETATGPGALARSVRFAALLALQIVTLAMVVCAYALVVSHGSVLGIL